MIINDPNQGLTQLKSAPQLMTLNLSHNSQISNNSNIKISASGHQPVVIQ
jgi:hypothetical protein